MLIYKLPLLFSLSVSRTSRRQRKILECDHFLAVKFSIAVPSHIIIKFSAF